jgi:hypothetical protein
MTAVDGGAAVNRSRIVPGGASDAIWAAVRGYRMNPTWHRMT